MFCIFFPGGIFKNIIFDSLQKCGLSQEEVSTFKAKLNQTVTYSKMKIFKSQNSNEIAKGHFEYLTLEKDLEYDYTIELINSSKFRAVFKKEIIKVVNHHRKLLSYCKFLEEFFSPVFLPIMLFALLYTIFSGFSAITVSLREKIHFKLKFKFRVISDKKHHLSNNSYMLFLMLCFSNFPLLHYWSRTTYSGNYIRKMLFFI